MADIAVVHPDLSMRGGAENVCMHVLQALQDDHDLTLLTLTRPDFDALNDYYRTEVRPPRVRVVGTLAPAVRDRAGHRLARLQAALLNRALERRAGDYDAIVSTKNEFAVDAPSIQFVHSPQFAALDPGLEESTLLGDVYGRICARIAGVDEDAFESTTLLANSEWTATTVSEAYGVDPEAVYPPIRVEDVDGRPWAEREPGFLTVGRVGPSKNVLRNVEVVSRLRGRGHDVHLHVVGPTTDGEYGERVRAAADAREFVTVEGAVSRERLETLIATHRYGLHGRPFEHFGIVVAELAAGGAIPFAPDSGGQVEILDHDHRLLYESVDDAVSTVDRVLSNPELQTLLRDGLASSTERFSRPRFEAEITDTVEGVLA